MTDSIMPGGMVPGDYSNAAPDFSDNRVAREITFEVTVRHRADDGQADPSEEDIRVAIERHLNGPFSVTMISVGRL